MENIIDITPHEERELAERPCSATMGRRWAAMRAAAAVLIVASAAGWTAPSRAQGAVGAELNLAELEKAFWVCDRAATIGRVDVGSASTCGSLTVALKQRKFDGDFSAMLAWWRQYKEAEHLALAKAGSASLARLAPAATQ